MMITADTRVRVRTDRSPTVLKDPDGKHQRAIDMFCAGVRRGEVNTVAYYQQYDYFCWRAAGITENNSRHFSQNFKQFLERRIETGVLEVVDVNTEIIQFGEAVNRKMKVADMAFEQ